MSAHELLRFDWKQNEMQLLMAALHDPGPARAAEWGLRAGVALKHFAEIRAELVRLGGIEAQERPEGWYLCVLPSNRWRVRERCTRERWLLAWVSNGQCRLTLQTEDPSLAELLLGLGNRADRADRSESEKPIERPESRNSGPVPKSGTPEIRDCSPRDPDRVILEKKGTSFSSTDSIEGVPDSGTGFPGERRYLLEKLARMWRLEQEILKPQGEQQRRMSRIFWECEREDMPWLVQTVGDLASRTEPMNKAAWLNVAITTRLRMIKATKQP